MASFTVTYNAILKYDIKHTHFGKPMNLRYRTTGDFPTFEQLRRMKENKQLRQRIIKGRTSTYHQRDIPDAPAFNTVSEEELDEIVERLCTATVASQGISNTSDSECVAQLQRRSADIRKPRTPAEQEALVSRISTPTHMSRVRAEMEPHKIVTEVNSAIPSKSLMVQKKQ